MFLRRRALIAASGLAATSFGLPAVGLVGAFAYLIALPAFFSVIMPLQPQATGAGRTAVA